MGTVLKVAQLGQPVLRKKAAEMAAEEIPSPQFQDFLDDMIATMVEHRGVGLAAPQVFSSRRVFLAAIVRPDEDFQDEDEPEIEVFINPRLENLSSEMETGWEGCLSFRELMVEVPRHRSLTIRYLNREGAEKALELSDYGARVIQHEFDHLEGILTIDRATSTQRIVKASEIDAVLNEEPGKTNE